MKNPVSSVTRAPRRDGTTATFIGAFIA